jgi:hypothetical protein
MTPPTLTTLPALTDLELRATAPLGTTLLDPDRLPEEGGKAA